MNYQCILLCIVGDLHFPPNGYRIRVNKFFVYIRSLVYIDAASNKFIHLVQGSSTKILGIIDFPLAMYFNDSVFRTNQRVHDLIDLNIHEIPVDGQVTITRIWHNRIHIQMFYYLYLSIQMIHADSDIFICDLKLL